MLKILFLLWSIFAFSNVIRVGTNQPIKSIKKAIEMAKNGDTILVSKGHYKEGNLNLDKSLSIFGEDMPVLDGQNHFEILSFRANNIHLKGFKIINSGENQVKNIGAIRLYNSQNTTIENNVFINNYFGIYIQRGIKCLIQNNKITSKITTSQEGSGNGIHAWQSEEIWIKNNYIEGHKDGIYLEKVTQSFIYKNYSKKNLRYGLHFMFADNNVYVGNTFDNNNAGVAVMYSKNINMHQNRFINNWGDSAYGLLLKDISYSTIKNNYFENNTTGIFMDGDTHINFYQNQMENNGWGLKISANCMDNTFKKNNFINNTFDVSTTGSLVMNVFNNNYWDKYEGYDLERDGIGDVPFHPLSLYAVLAERNPSVMLLFKTFLMDMLNRTEKMVPSLTPENFVDEEPLIRKVKIKY